MICLLISTLLKIIIRPVAYRDWLQYLCILGNPTRQNEDLLVCKEDCQLRKHGGSSPHSQRKLLKPTYIHSSSCSRIRPQWRGVCPNSQTSLRPCPTTLPASSCRQGLPMVARWTQKEMTNLAGDTGLYKKWVRHGETLSSLSSTSTNNHEIIGYDEGMISDISG